MKYLKRFFYGLLIGLGKIIPGVSGSVIALSLGVYEHSISSINNFFKDIKGNIIYLLPLLIGIIISIILSSKIVIYLLNNYYISTIFFFLGLIIGSIHDICKHTKLRYTHLTIISFTLLTFIGTISKSKIILSQNNNQFITYIIIGIIDAFCMIIPGLSGTALLMMLGCYKMLINMLSSMTNFNHLIDNIKNIFPFTIGLIIGLFLTIKLVDFLFKKYFNKTYNIILGFLISSILYMFQTTFKYQYTYKNTILSIPLFIIGYKLIKKINHN